MKKIFVFITIAVLMTACICVTSSCGNAPIPVKILLLPAFEVNQMSGDFPGEAQYYYEEYLMDGEEYEIEGCAEGTKLYYKDGIALCLLGEGKVSAALATSALLNDDRFDFFDTYFIVTGCAGAAKGYGVMGDVFVISALVDYDLGHHADPREMEKDSEETWFHDEEYDSYAVVKLNQELTNQVYELVKDTKLETTENTRKHMKESFPGEKWADREPQVRKGTAVVGDNFWKGNYHHANAKLIAKTYDCPDPYAVTDMEDIAVGLVLRDYGKLDRLIVLRDAVNMDVFGIGSSPEKLWDPKDDDDLASGSSEESIDIFETAMKNNFTVGKTVIEAILNGEITK